MKTLLLDAGHGGMINGLYQTSGKRSPVWNDGTQLFEGELNRQIKARIFELCHFDGIRYVDINPQQTDLSLQDRVTKANTYNSKESIFVSLHSNAGGGTGCEVFIAEQHSTTSKQMAESVEANYKNFFPNERWRGIRKKNFYVIKNTSMPAILVESFFMDTEAECKVYLMSAKGRDKIAHWIYSSIKKFLI